MRKILKLGLKRKIFPTVIIIVFTFMFFLCFETVEASRRSLRLHELMENSLVDSRKVEINSKVFDVYINHTEKSITVQGEVKDWKEKERVEKYFRLRSPSDYQVNFDIAIVY